MVTWLVHNLNVQHLKMVQSLTLTEAYIHDNGTVSDR